jgi:nitrate reductase cytochrome c-type subunit
MKKLFILSAILSMTLLNATTNKEIKIEAKKAIKKMGKSLQSHMKKNLKKGGAIQAAKFCSKKATKIEEDINAKYKKGISVKRVSLKYRNPDNAPLADEKAVLEQIEADFKSGKKIPKMIVKQIDKNNYKVYKPIFLEKKACLKCHGDADHRAKKAYKIIKEKYPDDKAIDYKAGDFRGAFVAKIVK